jgi:hypothetical protein
VLLVVGAFAVPLACCDDQLMGLPNRSVQQIKIEARHSSDLPILKQQLIVHEASESLESTRASVIWRTAFGIEVARGEFNGRGVGMPFELWDYFRPWALLGLAVVVLLIPAGLLIRRDTPSRLNDGRGLLQNLGLAVGVLDGDVSHRRAGVGGAMPVRLAGGDEDCVADGDDVLLLGSADLADARDDIEELVARMGVQVRTCARREVHDGAVQLCTIL